ncbi:MAG: hypothetical protein AAGF11_43985 [Myxococcota bacterium]
MLEHRAGWPWHRTYRFTPEPFEIPEGWTESNDNNKYWHKYIGLPDLESGDVNDHRLGHDPDGDRRRNQARIFRWYYDQLAYMIDRLKSIPESDGSTLFDNTLIVTCSEFGSYNHRENDIPYILIGNPNNAFNKGVYLDARSNGNFRSHADLLLAIAQGLGAPLSSFGTSSSPYTGVLA